MKRTTAACRGIPPCLALAAALAAVAAGCSRPDRSDIPREEREFLEGWAARLAPAMVLPGELAASPPDTAGLRGLIEFCDEDPDRYLYLYGCLRDSIGSVPPPDPDCINDPDPGIEAPDSVTGQAGSP